jgi:hypothetical protein
VIKKKKKKKFRHKRKKERMTSDTGRPVTTTMPRTFLLAVFMLLASVSVESKFITIYDNFDSTGSQTAFPGTPDIRPIFRPTLNSEADYILLNSGPSGSVTFTTQNNRGELFCASGTTCSFAIQYDGPDGGLTFLDKSVTLSDPTLDGSWAYALNINSKGTYLALFTINGPSTAYTISFTITPGSRNYLFPFSDIVGVAFDNIKAIQVSFQSNVGTRFTINTSVFLLLTSSCLTKKKKKVWDMGQRDQGSCLQGH